jgi:4-amino-4-deoxy-L-arabinose transferase-like glycosyltransferase
MTTSTPIAARASRLPGALLALGAVLLLLPGLGSFGLWEPFELDLVDEARSSAGATLKPGAAAAWLAALGLRVASGEWGARLPFALSALATLAVVYAIGRDLFGPRAAALASVVLLTTPQFLLQGRQVFSDMPLQLGHALALLGLVRFAWPTEGGGKARHLLLGVGGLLVGTLLGGGALVGAVVPLGALAGALLVARGSLPAPGLRGRRGLLALLVAAALLVVLVAVGPYVAGKASWLLGGTPRGGQPGQRFEFFLRAVGFGLFPWSALAFFGLGRPAALLVGGGEDPAGSPEARRLFAGLVLLLFAGLGFTFGTAQVLLTGERRFALLVPLALAAGALLDDIQARRVRSPVLALIVATGTMLLARDLVQEPEGLASAHLGGAKLTWPTGVSLRAAVLAAGGLFAIGLVGWAAPPAAEPVTVIDAPGSRGRLARRFATLFGPLLGLVARIARRLWGLATRLAQALTLLAAAGFAIYLVHALVPTLSKHLSPKHLVDRYAEVTAQSPGPLALYKTPRAGIFPSHSQELSVEADLVTFLRKPERAFAIIQAGELAAVNLAMRTAQIPYGVVDGSSSKLVLVANRLLPEERDDSPLASLVWMPPPGAGPEARPPWPAPQHPGDCVFGDQIEYLGADYPAEVRRPTDLPLTLHFRVKQKTPAGYAIFVHLELPGHPIVNGDHSPLKNLFATAYWYPGEYLRDKHEIELPLMTNDPGTYTIHFGFWPGGNTVGTRIAVTAGNRDTQNRCYVGRVDVK